MIYRKLIKFGNSSYVVSLPAEWIKKNNLNKGSVIFLDSDINDNIILSPKEIKNKENLQSYVLKTDNKGTKKLIRSLYSLYITGHDEIIIQGENLPLVSNQLISAAHNLMGIEVMEATHNKIILKDLIDVESISISNIITKMTLISKSLFEDCIKCKNKEDVDRLFERDKNVNRMTHFVKRILNKCIEQPHLARKLKLNNRDIYNNIRLIIYIERIADLSKWIGENIQTLDKKYWNKIESEFLVLHNTTFEKINSCFNIYNKTDIVEAVESIEEYKQLVKKLNDFSTKYEDPSVTRIIEKMKFLMNNIKGILRIII